MVYAYDDDERLFTGHTGRVFLVLLSAWLFVSLTRRLLPPLLPEIIDTLAITAFLAGLAITAERIVSASMEYPSGRVADDVSRTAVVLGCLCLVFLGTALLVVAPTYAIFVVGLVIFGFGNGMYAPAARALLTDMFRRKRGLAIGINMIGSDLSGIIAAGFAIAIVALATWRMAFVPILLALVPTFVALYLLSRETTMTWSVELDVRGTGSRLLGDPALRLILVVYSLYVFASTGVGTFLPLFLIEIHDVSFGVASGSFALLYATGMVAKPIGGFTSDQFPRLVVAGGAMLIAAGGLVLLIVAPTIGPALAGVVVYAFGFRGLPPSLQAYLMARFPSATKAGDLGAMRSVYMLTGSFGPAYAGFIAGLLGFKYAFRSFVVFFAVGAAILLVLSRRVSSSGVEAVE